MIRKIKVLNSASHTFFAFLVEMMLLHDRKIVSCEANLEQNFSIKVYKQYFNFASAHFLVFADGTREPLHGHNYRVAVEGKKKMLNSDMVFDFLDLKPLVRDLCNTLDHRLILPSENPLLKFETSQETPEIQWVTTPDGFRWNFPKNDIVVLPIPNTSVERLAQYFALELVQLIKNKFNFYFSELVLEIEETPGQSAVFTFTDSTISEG